jgi:hypothetical protein
MDVTFPVRQDQATTTATWETAEQKHGISGILGLQSLLFLRFVFLSVSLLYYNLIYLFNIFARASEAWPRAPTVYH